ncbi:hypothetical protein KC992_00110 [Candidatus Saccharibacteria bacterium]|nr:hypothetical protein [Candidatus Saccharibacteria bacterium]
MANKNKEKDYIKLLHQYAFEHISEGTSFPEIISHLSSCGVKTDDVHLKQSIARAFSQTFVDSSRPVIGFNINDTGKHYMLVDAYFRYLEYLELEESRKNAESAKVISIIAIGLTLLALIASVIIGILQINQINP